MEYEKRIAEFLTEKVGGIYIKDSQTGIILFADRFLKQEYGEDITGKTAVEVFSWEDSCPWDMELSEKAYEWEHIDIATKRYWKINSWIFTEDDKNYRIEQVTDVTEYMSLSSEVTKYMSFFKKLSAFQSAVFMHLRENTNTLLPLIGDYMKVPRISFLLERGEFVESVTYEAGTKQFETKRIKRNWVLKQFLSAENGEEIPISELPLEIKQIFGNEGSENAGKRIICLCSGVISNQRYAIYVLPGVKTLQEALQEDMIISVIRLYIENGIMRENIIYNGEHDAMTGLYNKGKYLERVEKEYQKLDQIAVFNFDVNNLKKMNDQFGHEMGDKLLIKAADSIRCVTCDRIHGYRMGGDEYLMIACNCDEEEAQTILQRWQNALEQLNKQTDGVNCVMAVGVACGKSGYDFAELMKLSDARMYEDKKRKKNGEEIR